MTLAEMETFIDNIRQAGGNDDTVIKVVTSQGSVKDIKSAVVWHVSGHPVITLQK